MAKYRRIIARTVISSRLTPAVTVGMETAFEVLLQQRDSMNVLHLRTGDHITAVTADFQACIEYGTVSQIVRQRTLAATAALTLA